MAKHHHSVPILDCDVRAIRGFTENRFEDRHGMSDATRMVSLMSVMAGHVAALCDEIWGETEGKQVFDQLMASAWDSKLFADEPLLDVEHLAERLN